MSVEAVSIADAKAIADEWRGLGGRDIHLA